MKFRFYIALLLAKLSIPALKITGHNGTDFPGSLALKVCPEFLRFIGKPAKIIGVTGTNGKTTISNLVTDSLSALGLTVLNNGFGSNIASGIVTMFIRGATIGGRTKYDTAVIEIDERSTRLLFKHFAPDYMIVTNLSRDSIMRNAHPEYIADFLTSAIPAKTKLIINADNLLAASVSPNNERIYFGIEEMPGDKRKSENLINDFQICPLCNGKLEFDYIRYSDVGKAHCVDCDYKSPECDTIASDVSIDDMTMTYTGGGQKRQFALMNDSIFNIYNQVATITLLQELGYSLEEIAGAFETVKIADTRYKVVQVGDINVIRMLAKEKNAFGSSRVFEHISTLSGSKELLLYNNCIGDTKHWSENTCWMYDCDFEFLIDADIKRIVVYGDRRLDLKMRLMMEGYPAEDIVCVVDPHDGVAALGFFPEDNIYILYGTDSLALGLEMERKVIERAEEVVAKRGGQDA